jgi:zinc transport system permease protein
LELLSYEFAQRALVGALLIGVLAPLVGSFLVQRRLALLSDGVGHIAITGVGLALLMSWAPLPAALIAAVLGALFIELLRDRSRVAADVAIAVVFYGGLALGVLLVSLVPGGAPTKLNTFLFGSLSTVSMSDLWVLGVMTALILLIIVFWGRQLFVAGLDPEVAMVQQIPVRALGVGLSVMSAATVVVGMRVVGLLLVSGIMVLPVAAASQFGKSFASTLGWAVLVGVLCAIGGLLLSFQVDVPPGPSIILGALLMFVLAVTWRLVRHLQGARR